MREYSEAFKRKVLQRLLMPTGPSANQLSQEVGVAQSTLSRWLREAATLDPVTKRRRPRPSLNRPVEQRRPDDRQADEKLRLMLEARTAALRDAKRAEVEKRIGGKPH